MSDYKVGDLASLFPLPQAKKSGKTLQSLFKQHHKKNIEFKPVKELGIPPFNTEDSVSKKANKKKRPFVDGNQNLKKTKSSKFEKPTEFIRTKKKKQNLHPKVPNISSNEISQTFETKIKKYTDEDFENVGEQPLKLKKKRQLQTVEPSNIFEKYAPDYSKSDENIKQKSENKFFKSYDEEEFLPCTLFVGNLPMSATRKTLKKLFNKFGVLKNCRIRGTVSAKSKVPKKAAAIKRTFHEGMKSQIGYVVFSDRESATKALSLNGHFIDDHHLIVNFAARSGEKKLYENDLSIFIGNLPFDVDEESVWTAFQPHGDVQAVRIIRDRLTGIGKGFGYVQFKDSVSKNSVLKISSLEIKERKIRIKAINDKSSQKFGSKDSLKMIRSNLASMKSKKYGNKKSVKKILKKERLVHHKKQIASKLGQKFTK